MTNRDIEGPIQRSVIAYLRTVLPGVVVHHSPNGVPLQGKDVARAMAKARYNGTLAGWPDIEAFWKGQVLLVEVKSPDGKLSDPQRLIGNRLSDNGFKVYLVRSVDDAARAVDDWLSSVGSVQVPVIGVIS